MGSEDRTRAIQLRIQGKTYREILEEVPVAKSTLSAWLKSVELAAPQKQRVTKLRKAAALRGAQSRRNKRLSEIATLNESGKREIGALSSRELWLIGIALYWGEGSKQRETTISTGVQLTNSDPLMLRFFLLWLKKMHISDNVLVFELYVHENRRSEVSNFKRWWAKQLGIEQHKFGAVYFKKDRILTNRKNVSDLYHGLVRIKVRASTSLNRRIAGWVRGIAQ